MDFTNNLLQNSWEAIVLAIGVIATLFSQLDKIFAVLQRIRNKVAVWLGDHGIEDEVMYQWPEELCARFANDRWEIKEILEIRKKYFVDYLDSDVIASDDVYWAAYESNPWAFSVVSEKRVPFGYWGLVPISKKDFFTFLEGKLTHAEILSGAVLSWREADPTELYLYHIGAVTLPVRSPDQHPGGIPLRAGKLELDNIASIYSISKHANICGLAVYPSTKEGAIAISRHFVKNGFIRTGILAATGDPLTEIAYLSGENVKIFLDNLHEEYVKPSLANKPSKRTRKLARLMNNKLIGPDYHQRVPRRSVREVALVIRELKMKV